MAGGSRDQLIVRGQANLLGDVHASEDLERIRTLFADLETKTDVIELLHRAETGEGVKIFIGSENKMFSLSGSSMIAAPLRDSDHRIAGAPGVASQARPAFSFGRCGGQMNGCVHAAMRRASIAAKRSLAFQPIRRTPI